MTYQKPLSTVSIFQNNGIGPILKQPMQQIFLFKTEEGSDCNNLYTVTSEWGIGLMATISIVVPLSTSSWSMKITYDTNVEGIGMSNF